MITKGTKALLILLFCLFSLLLSITGCSGGKGEESKVRVTFYCGTSLEEAKMYRKLIGSFEEKYPDIKIRFLDEKKIEKLLTMVAGGTPPDVVFLVPPMPRTFFERGLLEDLTPYIEKTPFLEIDDFYSETLDAFTFNGRIYALPMGWGPLVLYYNKKMFDKEKIPYPDDTWTWEDLVNYGKKLTKLDERGRPLQFGLIGHTIHCNWQAFVLQNGGKLYNEEGTKCLLDSPEAIEAIKFVGDLSTRYRIAPTIAQFRELSSAQEDLFLSGMAAMSMIGRWYTPAYRKARFEWDVAPLPRGKERANMIVVASYSILSSSKHKEEAWKFVSHLLDKNEGARLMAEIGFVVPYRRSIAESKLFLSSTPPFNNRVFIDELKYAKMVHDMNPFVSRHYREWYTEIFQALDLIWMGEKKAEDYLPGVISEINARIARSQSQK